MLFTDRDVITIDDLVTIDPDIAEVCSVENIPLEGDGGLVHRAVEECANMLLGEFQNFSYFWNAQTLVSEFPTLIGYADATPPPRIKLGQVVTDSDTTTYWSPIKQFCAYLALRNVYQVASNRKIDDKYDTKRQQLERDVNNKYWSAIKSSGLPIVNVPIPCPGAKYELTQGVWNQNNVTQVPGGSSSAETWDVAITWLTNNAESAPSETITVAVDANSVIKVDISSLIAPTTATSWKVFVGVQGGPLYLQATIQASTTSYTFSGAPVLSGSVVGRGQAKDINLTFINLFSRG